MGPLLKLPKYVHGWIENGRPRFYFRRRGFKHVKLPGLPYSPEFMRAYEAALAGAPRLLVAPTRAATGSVSHTVSWRRLRGPCAVLCWNASAATTAISGSA